MSDVDENLKNSILTFSIYMVSQVLLEDLDAEEEHLSRQDNLDFILRLMILSAKTLHNPVTLSMAMQLAMEMSQRGLNSTAVEAVRNPCSTVNGLFFANLYRQLSYSTRTR